MITFKGRLLIFGAGSVAQCVLAMLFDLINIDPKNITVIDSTHKESRIFDAIQKGIHYKIQRVTKENYKSILSSHLEKGDFLLDLSVEIDTIDLLSWCKDHDVLYVNTSVEVWDDIQALQKKDLREQTLYLRHVKLHETVSSWPKGLSTAIVEHGANPGLVSHFAKKALADMAKNVKDEKVQEALKKKNFPKLGHLLDVKTIHISEIDTQVSSKPKEKDEFVNTWSCDGLIEEAIAPAELGWGIHEKELPITALEHLVGKKHQILLKTKGLHSLVHSWVPSGNIKGMVIRHGEAYSLCDTLTLKEKNKVIYRPTVHYAYYPCQDAILSLKELEERDFKPQTKKRILNDEIESGRDELGCLLMGHPFKAWWIGSILDIKDARKLAPHQSATTVQVAIGVIAAMIYAMENPRLGVLVPDDLDYERILEIATPYLGSFVSKPSDYLITNTYQFTDFLVN